MATAQEKATPTSFASAAGKAAAADGVLQSWTDPSQDPITKRSPTSVSLIRPVSSLSPDPNTKGNSTHLHSENYSIFFSSHL
jgi:primary-amine oxidase